MKRPAAAMEPDLEPEVLDWDDPEVLDFEDDEPQVIDIVSENNPADLASSDNTDVSVVDYSYMNIPQALPLIAPPRVEPSLSSEQTTDTRPIVRSKVTPQVDTGASHSIGPSRTNDMFRPAVQRIPRYQRLSNIGRW